MIIWEVIKLTNCYFRIDCNRLSVIAGIIIGIIAAVLTFSATIVITPAFLWVALGIAVVYLAVLLLTSVITRRHNDCRCAQEGLPVALAGILGTILTSLILLGVGFAATSILGAIITGTLFFFLTLIFGGIVCYIRCNVPSCCD